LLAVLLSETDGVYIQHSELPIPALAFGAIAMGVFALLAFVVFSYRDVANRHDHKNSSSQGH
jgi:heme/copper-type cytochrome/quinol oxidase subunit 2